MLKKQIQNILSNPIKTDFGDSPQYQHNDSFESQNSGRHEYDSERYQQVDGMQENDIQGKNKKQQQQQQQQTKKSSLLQNMEKMEQKRQERREKMNQMKQQKLEKEQLNKESNRNVDIDYEMLIETERLTFSLEHVPISNNRLNVIVRKRPLFQKEEEDGELDSISCSNPIIRVHEPKYKVDGITKYIENHDFEFDNAFSEVEQTEDVYKYSLQPIIKCVFDYGVVTCFAYGQTGSGKTFTMKGLQQHYINDLFQIISTTQAFSLTISFFEIYAGKCYDLLNERNQLNILEDKNNNVQIQNLVEKQVRDQLEMIEIIEQAAVIRTTHATEANEESSRSHAICQIVVKESNGNPRGKLIMVDLAGSERAQDCQSNSKQRKIEGANINQSLLALKECIRSMDQGAQHVPFRGSKLTLVLRDSFLSKSSNSHIVMFACISPGSSSSDHTVNTLRYADRLKETTGIKQEVIKIIEEQSKNKRKKWQSQPQAQQQQQQQTASKNKEGEEVESMKKVAAAVPASKKNMILKTDPNEEKQYDHTLYLLNNRKNKENISSAENIPSINKEKSNQNHASNKDKNHTSDKDKNNAQDKDRNTKQQNKPSLISKIPQTNQQNQTELCEQNQKQIKSNQQTSCNSTTAAASNSLNQEKREDRPQTQKEKRQSSVKRGVSVAESNNSKSNNYLQQKSLNTENNALGGVSNNTDKPKATSQKQLKQNTESNQVLTQSQQQQQPIIGLAPQQNNIKEQLNNPQLQQGNKKGNQAQKKNNNNTDNQVTLNNKHNRDSSSNNCKQQIDNNSLNDHILQKNKEVQENIQKAQQHQLEQKTKDIVFKQLKEKQEDIFSSHMSAIKEDANLLSLESGLLTDCQRDGFMDCDIDNYVKKFESIVTKKLFMYNLLQQKMDQFKKINSEYTNKYCSQPIQKDSKQTSNAPNQNKQEENGKKRQSFLLKKKTDNY